MHGTPTLPLIKNSLNPSIPTSLESEWMISSGDSRFQPGSWPALVTWPDPQLLVVGILGINCVSLWCLSPN